MDPALLAPIDALIDSGDLRAAKKMLQRVLETGTTRRDPYALMALVPLSEKYAARATGPAQAWAQHFRFTLHQNIAFVRAGPAHPPPAWTPQDVTGRQGDWYLFAATAVAGVALAAALIAGVTFIWYRVLHVANGCLPGYRPRYYRCGPRLDIAGLHRVARDTAAGAVGLAIVSGSLFVTGMLRRKG
jgi:hypothetical protein